MSLKRDECLDKLLEYQKCRFVSTGFVRDCSLHYCGPYDASVES